MSEKHKAVPAVHIEIASVEGNHGDYLSIEFLEKINSVFDAMLSRLYYGAYKRRGWATPEPWNELSESECRTCVRDALSKGNLIDAMNYTMFAHLNGHNHLTLRNPSPEVPVSVDSQMRDQLAKALGTAGRTREEMLDHVIKMRKEAVEQTEAFAQIAAALQMGPETPPKHPANIIESQLTAQKYEHQKTIESIAKELKLDPDAPADTIISTVHFLVTARRSAVTEINITGGTDLETLENVAKAMKANNQSAAFAWDGRKASLPPAMAAPYGVKASKKRQQYELTMEADDSGIPSPLFIFRSKKDRDDYLPLLRTFLGALEQAAYGKGRERHANDLPFIEQPILTMARMLDSDAGLAQQVIKKTVEARSLPMKKARVNELRGTLVYAAAMILFEEMYGRADDPDNLNGAL